MPISKTPIIRDFFVKIPSTVAIMRVQFSCTNSMFVASPPHGLWWKLIRREDYEHSVIHKLS